MTNTLTTTVELHQKQLDEEYNKGKEEERERILKIIPKTWLDHLLEPYLNKKEFTPKDIENILMMIREEIKQSSGRENGK